jgi:exopolysaccharide biosynthesis polyprenyl glycosylphosphotransferase
VQLEGQGGSLPPLPEFRLLTGREERPAAKNPTQAAVLRRDGLLRRALGLADAISAAAAVWLGAAVLGDDQVSPALLLALPLVVLVSKVVGLYDRDENLIRKTTLEEVPAIFQVATLYAILMLLLEDVYLTIGQLGHQQLLVLWTLLFTFMVVGRTLARRVTRSLLQPERCLVIGGSPAAKQIQRTFDLSPSVEAMVVGRIALDDQDRNGGVPPIATDVSALAPMLAEHEIHRVIVAPDVSDSEEILDVIRQVKGLGVAVSVLPRLFEVVESSVDLDDVDGLTLLGVHRYGLTKSSELLKRAMDLVGATLGLVVLSPVLLVIGLVIKLTSPGPVLFRQPRIGQGGGEFEVLKFRTMVDGADARKDELADLNEAAEGLFKIADDPRVTRVGRFLRQSCLDELPQLVNVLRGDMSLVGPRPLVPDEDRRTEGWQRDRLLLKPGMTGHWQIFGASRIPLKDMAKIDYLYGANWSLWLDTRILLRTLPYALRRAGL